MYVSVLPTCIYVNHVFGTLGDQKMVLHSVELELKMVVSWEPNLGPLQQFLVIEPFF